MKNELYVVSLVRTSDRARAVAAQVHGNFAMTDLLRRISRFGQAQENLAELATRIRVAFQPPSLPTVFTGRHLEMLVQSRARHVLASALRCPESDVIPTLFDSGQLASALREAGHTWTGSLDSEALLLALLPRMTRLEAQHGLESRDWGQFIEASGWLTPRALSELAEVARQKGWPDEARSVQVLAGLLEDLGERPGIGNAPRFDVLALIELRRRISLIAEQFRNEAMQYANDAAQLAPELTTVARLPALIELYELKSVAIGLRQLFTGTTSVGELLEGMYNVPSAAGGEPDPDVGLEVTNEITFGTFKRRIAFDVICAVEGEARPQVILQCRGLPRDAYPAIRVAIQLLRGGDLSRKGKNLGERLLNTHVAQREGLAGRLRSALAKHETEAVQCVVLTGNRQPIGIPSPWHEYLANALPYESLPDGDVRLSVLADVVDELRASVSPQRPIEVVA